MAKLDLPSGGWVEYRTDLKASDRFAVQAVAKVQVGTGEERTTASFLEMQNDMQKCPSRPYYHRLVFL